MPEFDLIHEMYPRWDPEKHDVKQLADALYQLFQSVASDLQIEMMSDEGFVDYASDRMSDARVPSDLIDRAKIWLSNGGPIGRGSVPIGF